MLGRYWLSVGVEISWDKTFISKNFAIFLNEIRYKNRCVATGARAFCKIRNVSDAALPSLLDDYQYLESTCRGAAVAGSPTCPVYFVMAYLAIDSVRKWAQKG